MNWERWAPATLIYASVTVAAITVAQWMGARQSAGEPFNTDTVNNGPYQLVLAFCAVGFIVGVLLRRKT